MDVSMSALQKAKHRLLPSPGLGAWLNEQKITLVVSTYQSKRVFFVSGLENGRVVALERAVGSAMGLAAGKDKLWIGSKDQVWRFSNVGPQSLKPEEPASSEILFDAVFVPRQLSVFGQCDAHDLLADVTHEGQHHEVLFVNTAFSCIAGIDQHYNFIPVWKPEFISSIGPGDRCHLNGMGSKEGELAYATACAETDAPQSWKKSKSSGGVLIDIKANTVLTRGLSMPHSPRWHDGRVWLLNSGEGLLGFVDPDHGVFTPVSDCPGFARGLSIHGHCAIVGLSRLRDNTLSSGLGIQSKLQSLNIQQRCGFVVIDTLSGETRHWLTIDGGITELFDVLVLPDVSRPFLPRLSSRDMSQSLFNIPDNRFPVAI